MINETIISVLAFLFAMSDDTQIKPVEATAVNEEPHVECTINYETKVLYCTWEDVDEATDSD